MLRGIIFVDWKRNDDWTTDLDFTRRMVPTFLSIHFCEMRFSRISMRLQTGSSSLFVRNASVARRSGSGQRPSSSQTSTLWFTTPITRAALYVLTREHKCYHDVYRTTGHLPFEMVVFLQVTGVGTACFVQVLETRRCFCLVGRNVRPTSFPDENQFIIVGGKPPSAEVLFQPEGEVEGLFKGDHHRY